MFQSDQIQPVENTFYSGDQAIRVSKLGAQTDDDDEGVYLKKEYAKSVRGILRASFIIIVIIGWIIIAASIKDRLLLNTVPTYRDTRTAYLVIGILATILSLIIYFFYLFNIFNSGFLKNIKWDILIIIFDIIFGICFLALGITCVVRETRLQKVNYIPLAIKKGTFMAAGIFALIAFVLSIALVIAHMVDMWKGKTSRSWDTNNTRNSIPRQQTSSGTA